MSLFKLSEYWSIVLGFGIFSGLIGFYTGIEPGIVFVLIVTAVVLIGNGLINWKVR